MTLKLAKPSTSKLVLAKTPGTGLDADAAAYIAAVEAADGQALEAGVRWNFDQFVRGCKADGIWTAIKACCILSGARTLNGALVPLVGTAPTNFNFVAGDYNRKTGLAGNGSTKYLNSNRANNADPQNSNHNACWVSSPAVGVLMASSDSNAGQNYMDTNTLSSTRFASRTNSSISIVSGLLTAGLYGHARSSSLSQRYRIPQGNGSGNFASQAPESRNVFLFTRSNDSVSFSNWSTARIAFYSIGEALDLALLDARITTLINSNALVIP